jgi:hypothetical protein
VSALSLTTAIASQYLNERDVARARVAELEAELARVRAALTHAHEFLTDKRIGTVRYMEGSDFYTDCGAAAAAVRRALGEASDGPSLSERVRAATLEECAELAQEFGWILPLRETAEMNEAMDDAACDVARQIVEAIRAKAASDG